MPRPAHGDARPRPLLQALLAKLPQVVLLEVAVAAEEYPLGSAGIVRFVFDRGQLYLADEVRYLPEPEVRGAAVPVDDRLLVQRVLEGGVERVGYHALPVVVVPRIFAEVAGLVYKTESSLTRNLPRKRKCRGDPPALDCPLVSERLTTLYHRVAAAPKPSRALSSIPIVSLEGHTQSASVKFARATMRTPEIKTQFPSGSRGHAEIRISNLPPWLPLLCMVVYIKGKSTMQIGVSSTLTVYHVGQFCVGLAERAEIGLCIDIANGMTYYTKLHQAPPRGHRRPREGPQARRNGRFCD